MQHILCSCPKLAQTEYKKRHDVVGRVIHSELSKEYGVECSDKWSEHSPKSVEENEEVKLLWDLTIQTDREIHHRRPDNSCGHTTGFYPGKIVLLRKNFAR